MGEDNVLAGGIEVLYTMKESLLELEGYQQKSVELSAEEERLEALIQSKERMIADEILLTVRKRQEEVSFSFDGQIEQTRVRLKKVKAKRDKKRDMKVFERIDAETENLVKEKRKLEMEAKSIFKVNQIPKMFNTRFFFAIFMPGELSDFLMFLVFSLISLALPYGVYLLTPMEKRNGIYLAILYIIIVGCITFLFMVIHKKVKVKHETALKEVRIIRTNLMRVAKSIQKISHSIKKDQDESGYGLEKFDEEIEALENQMSKIAEEKKEALNLFENKTKKVVIDEIKSQYTQELDQLKVKYNQAYEECKNAGEKVNSFVLEISRKYETYVGKEVMNLSMIDSLIEIIQDKNASNISEALNFYKNIMNQAQIQEEN